MSIQETTAAAVDTLTETYSDKWEGVQGAEQASEFVQIMASNDLIFVVLGVSLIIWFVLLFFMIRTDKKIQKLEESINNESNET
jgi:hypothetical protein